MKKIIAITLAVMMAASTTACSSGGSAPTAAAPAETTASAEASKESESETLVDEYKEAEVEADEDKVVKGGKLVIGTLTECNSYASWRIRSEFYLLGPVYEPLIQFDENGEIQPYLAESLTADPENLTYTVKLRDGVTFSDGSPLDGEALLWNFENFKENSQTSSTHFGSVDHFELVDDMTVVIHLTEWNTQIPFSLNNCAGMMYSKKAFDENGYDWCLEHPVGTGPYVLVENVTDSYKKFVKNENYWNTEEPPLYDEIEARILGDNMAAQAALLNGDIDIFNGGDYGMKNNLVEMGYNLYQNKMWYRATFLIFGSDVEGSPMCDARVRKAIAYAIDADAMVKALDYNRTFVSNQYAVEGTPFYNPDVVGYDYNPEKAKELLAEAGYADGFSTKIVTGINQDCERYMIAIQDYLSAVGIDAELVYLDNAAWQSSGIYEIDDGMIRSFHGYGSNLVNQADANFSKRAVGGVGMLNKSKIHPDDLDDVLMRALSATDENEMYSLMQEAEKLIIDEYMIGYPVITSYYDQIITQPNIVDVGFCNTFNRGNNYNKLYRVEK